MDTKSYRQAIIQATKFLLSQQNDDGSIRPVEHGVGTLHKVPFALSTMGQFDRAARLCAYAYENVMDDEGDLVGHFSRSPRHQHYYLVSNAWLAAGAQRLGHFELSLRAADFIGSLQHPQSGGFFTAGPAASIDGEQDVFTTATCGLALLYCGRVEEATQAGEFLRQVWEKQPAGSARLYTRTQAGKDLVTEIQDDEAFDSVLIVGKPGQAYHIPAVAAGFLTKLAEVTGSQPFVETAQKLANFLDGCGADRYQSEASGLFGWAAAILYANSGNQNYRRIATAVADGLVQSQLANGSWLKASMGEDLTSDVIDGTAEGVICLTQILEGLCSGD